MSRAKSVTRRDEKETDEHRKRDARTRQKRRGDRTLKRCIIFWKKKKREKRESEEEEKHISRKWVMFYVWEFIICEGQMKEKMKKRWEREHVHYYYYSFSSYYYTRTSSIITQQQRITTTTITYCYFSYFTTLLLLRYYAIIRFQGHCLSFIAVLFNPTTNNNNDITNIIARGDATTRDASGKRWRGDRIWCPSDAKRGKSAMSVHAPYPKREMTTLYMLIRVYVHEFYERRKHKERAWVRRKREKERNHQE